MSCHAEGGDDGHVWNFDVSGPRRTQSLRGGLLATAPFHWDGQMTDLTTLMNAVFVGRMASPPPSPSTIDAVGGWLDAQLPASKAPPSDPAAVARGQALFNDATVGCATCHSGPHYTNNQTLNVGTGQPLQVPSLIDVVSRPPFLHNGCAPTLRDRFNPACGGGDQHGHTSQLSTGQIDDLVAFLSTL
jgi:mono/diheme cytochrome c family protein